MEMRVPVAAGLGLAMVAASANADMTGNAYQNSYSVSAIDVVVAPDFNGTVVDLWLEFDDSADILLNVYSFNDVNLGTTYYQSNTGATWLPQNLGHPFSTPALQSADSIVSIGGDGGNQTNANGTGLDPNFGGPNAAGPGANGGWYNSDPTNPIGQVIATGVTSTGLGVFIGRFAMNGGDVSMIGSAGSGSWNQGLGTAVQQADFVLSVSAVPLPASAWMGLALLGGMGVVGVMRRRMRSA